mmetsp:Transcript_12707/g.23082  ORF Transcript_12707/g.23082 Transcript_12707/m.23082 type:complete len:82 (+) Transcript_12707:242-487(+)
MGLYAHTLSEIHVSHSWLPREACRRERLRAISSSSLFSLAASSTTGRGLVAKLSEYRFSRGLGEAANALLLLSLIPFVLGS